MGMPRFLCARIRGRGSPSKRRDAAWTITGYLVIGVVVYSSIFWSAMVMVGHDLMPRARRSAEPSEPKYCRERRGRGEAPAPGLGLL
jgi:hypothetical protein